MITKFIPIKWLYSFTERLAQKGRYDNAIKITKERIEAEKGNSYLKIHLAHLYNKKYDHSKAFEIIQGLIIKHPDSKENAKIRWALANALLALREYSNAIPLLVDSEKYWKASSSPKAFTGMAHLYLKEYQEAEKFFDEALEINNKDFDARSGLVIIYKKTQRYQKIKPFLDDYLACAAEYVTPHELLGDYALNVEKDYSKAYTYYAHALDLYNTSKKHMHYRDHINTWNYPSSLVDMCIYTLVNQGFERKAKELNKQYFKKYEKWYPYICLETDDIQQALYYSKKNLRRFPDSVLCLQELGELNMLAKKYELSEKYLLDALTIARKSHEVFVTNYTPLVVLYGLTKDRKKSTSMLDKALELDVEDTWAELATLYRKVGAWEESLDAARKVTTLFPQNRSYLEELSEAQMMTGKRKDALKNCEELLKIQPKNGRAWLIKAKILSSSGEVEKALMAISEAIKTHNLSIALKTEAIELKYKIEEKQGSP